MVFNRCNCYFSCWVIFCPFTSLKARKIKIKKKKKQKKNAWRYHDLTQVYQKPWSYAVLFLRYGMRRCNLLFFSLGYFLPFYPTNTPKNKFYKNEKKTRGDIINLHMCTKNYDELMYGSWDMVHEGQMEGQTKH